MFYVWCSCFLCAGFAQMCFSSESYIKCCGLGRHCQSPPPGLRRFGLTQSPHRFLEGSATSLWAFGYIYSWPFAISLFLWPASIVCFDEKKTNFKENAVGVQPRPREARHKEVSQIAAHQSFAIESSTSRDVIGLNSRPRVSQAEKGDNTLVKTEGKKS